MSALPTVKNQFVKIELTQVKTYDEWAIEVDTLTAQITQLKMVADETTRKEMYEAVTAAKKMMKSVGEERLKITRLLDAKKQEFIQVEKRLLFYLEQAAAAKEKSIRDFDRVQVALKQEQEAAIKQQQEEQKRIEQEKLSKLEQPKAIPTTPGVVNKFNIAPTLPQAAAPPIEVPIVGKGVTMVWTYKIKQLNDVPFIYWILNEAAIKEDIKNGKREIEGLEIFEEPKTTFR